MQQLTPSRASRAPRRRGRSSHRLAVAACALTVLGSSLVAGQSALAASGPRAATPQATSPTYPIGVFDLGHPSILAPPPWNALSGYSRTFVEDFTQPLSTKLWFYFNGVPKGDPSGRFSKEHVAVSHGQLKIGTWRDPRFNNQWTSGGAGLSGEQSTYGAYFVRSRETAPGPDTAELLWPVNEKWPPEIDFDEAGEAGSTVQWFVHYQSPKNQVVGTTSINVTHWHTWGVIWTPTSITFTVDGRAWGKVTASNQIPTSAMTLDLQSQSWCGIKGQACPHRASILLVDWVAKYTAN